MFGDRRRIGPGFQRHEGETELAVILRLFHDPVQCRFQFGDLLVFIHGGAGEFDPVLLAEHQAVAGNQFFADEFPGNDRIKERGENFRFLIICGIMVHQIVCFRCIDFCQNLETVGKQLAIIPGGIDLPFQVRQRLVPAIRQLVQGGGGSGVEKVVHGKRFGQVLHR